MRAGIRKRKNYNNLKKYMIYKIQNKLNKQDYFFITEQQAEKINNLSKLERSQEIKIVDLQDKTKYFIPKEYLCFEDLEKVKDMKSEKIQEDNKSYYSFEEKKFYDDKIKLLKRKTEEKIKDFRFSKIIVETILKENWNEKWENYILKLQNNFFKKEINFNEAEEIYFKSFSGSKETKEYEEYKNEIENLVKNHKPKNFYPNFWLKEYWKKNRVKISIWQNAFLEILGKTISNYNNIK